MGDRHQLTCQCPFCTWVREMKDYPIGKYDDTVMGSYFAREASKVGIIEGTPTVHGVRETAGISVEEF